MNIVIIEDEPLIAEDIQRLCKSILEEKIKSIQIVHSKEDALAFLERRTIDLCLLDLNLKGESGYDILKTAVSRSFHTIIISAHVEQAIDAFEYGVLDFVPKPIGRLRLKQALDKFFDVTETQKSTLKYLVVHKKNMNQLLSVDDIVLFEAEGYLTKILLNDGRTELIEKSLNRLIQILPARFLRVHRSFIVDRTHIVSFRHKVGSTYEVLLQNDLRIPMNPQAYKLLLQQTDKKE
jgi:DNA-binding LytR/AlgR family response regulator